LHHVIVHPPYQLYVWVHSSTNIAVYDPKLVDLKERVISNKCAKYLLYNATAYRNKGSAALVYCYKI